MITDFAASLQPIHLVVGFLIEAFALVLLSYRVRLGFLVAFLALAGWVALCIYVLHGDLSPATVQEGAYVIFGPTLIATAIGTLLWLFFPRHTYGNPRPLSGWAITALTLAYPVLAVLTAIGWPADAKQTLFGLSLFVFSLPWLLIALGYTTGWLLLAYYYFVWFVVDFILHGLTDFNWLRAGLVIIPALWGLIKWKGYQDQYIPQSNPARS